MTAMNAFDPDLIRRYDGPGPRYTSYPTAPQFSLDFTAEDYRQLCASSNGRRPRKPLSVYVHIPFCKSLCYYCACSKIVTRHPEKAARYLERLHKEIDLQAALFESERPLEQLHFGGGTPTYLTTSQMGGLMEHLEQGFGFAPPSEREFSIEIDPRTLDSGGLDELMAQGFNRVSFGVQDLNTRVQEAVNRIQSEEMTLNAIAEARRSGFGALSLDLIYGLPHQTVRSFADTVEQVIAMLPERLAIYNYAHLPDLFRAQRLINEEDLPGPEQKLEIFAEVVRLLTAAGYVHIGLDHFALPDDGLVVAQRNNTLQRNFQGYSTHADCDLIGLGLTSIGKVAEGYSQNHKLLSDYYAAIDSGELPVVRGMRLSHDDRLRRAVIQRLMCHSRLLKADIESDFDIVFDRYFAAQLESLATLAADGLVELSDAEITVSEKGRFLLRPIAMVFDAYLPAQPAQGKFSKVI